MKNLKRMLLAVAMLCVVSVSAFAFDDQNAFAFNDQKKDEQKRPPKPDRPVVRVEQKRDRPPDNRQEPRNDNNKRGRP
jgi:hypothetical protein